MQTQLSDAARDVRGDCYRTCIACILDMDPGDVPNFVELYDRDFGRMASQWMRETGHINIVSVLDWSLGEVLEYNESMHWGIHYILIGGTDRDTNHAVVARGGTVVHDPHPAGSGLTGPTDSGIFRTEHILRLMDA